MADHGRSRAGLLSVALVAGLCGCASTPDWRPPEFLSVLIPRTRSSPPGTELKDPVKLHMAYAQMQERAGNLPEARKSYESVLGEKPKSVEAILGLARLDHLAGRETEAEQGYQRAFELAPNDPKVLDSVGQFFVERKHWTKAVEILNRAVASAPEDALVRQHLAIALAKSGAVDAAIPHFARTVGDAAAHYNVALILYEQGNVQQAQQHLLQAVVIQPDLRDAQYWLDEIQREQETQVLLRHAANPSQRVQDLPPPGERNESRSKDDIQLVRGQRPVISPATPHGNDSFDSASDPAASPPGRPPIGPQNPQAAPSSVPSQTSPTSMTPEQMEQWRNSMTPQQFEQWRNQMN